MHEEEARIDGIMDLGVMCMMQQRHVTRRTEQDRTYQQNRMDAGTFLRVKEILCACMCSIEPL